MPSVHSYDCFHTADRCRLQVEIDLSHLGDSSMENHKAIKHHNELVLRVRVMDHEKLADQLLGSVHVSLDSMLAVAANQSLEPRTQRFENAQLQTLKGTGAGTLGTVSFTVIFTPYQA
jgi:hypothetical protein